MNTTEGDRQRDLELQRQLETAMRNRENLEAYKRRLAFWRLRQSCNQAAPKPKPARSSMLFNMGMAL